MLSAANITLRRGGRTLVEGLSLAVGAGELILLTGPNGAGKTTLLRALAGFCPLAKGTLTRTAAFCLVGSVPAVKDVLTVAEHQRLWAQLYKSGCHPGGRRDLILAGEGAENTPSRHEIPASAGMTPQSKTRGVYKSTRCVSPFPLPPADTPGKTLSSGQKQRLHLSRLWLSQAPLWLIDEPLNALDSAATAAFTDGLAAHLARGGAAVVASHQATALTPARQICLEPIEAKAADAPLTEDALAAW